MKISELIHESIERIETASGWDIIVYKNPMPDVLKNLIYIRGMIDINNDLYIWDAYDITHYQVAEKLNLTIKYQFQLTKNDHDELNWEGGWQKALGNTFFQRTFRSYIPVGFNQKP